MDYIYQADFMSDPDGGFIVTFPDIPEAITAGATRFEAMINASDCLGTALLFYFEDGRKLPETNYKSGIPIQPGIIYIAHFETVLAVRDSGLTIEGLSRRTGKTADRIRRILSFKRGTAIPAFELVLRVLGKKFAIEAKELPG